MSKDFLNDEMVVESLYRARMEQWIGDFEEAEKIYDIVLNLESKMVIYLKPSIEDKKKKLAEEQSIYADWHMVASKASAQIALDPYFQKARFGGKKVIPRILEEETIHILSPIDSIWKYSIIATSKASNMIRFEVRGYPQTRRKPHLINLSNITGDFEITNILYTPLEEKPDSVGIDVSFGDEKMAYYIEIDSWGAIHGEAIVSMGSVDFFLEKQSVFLEDLERNLWGG